MFTLRHSKQKKFLSKTGDWTSDIREAKWFDAWVSVAELELKKGGDCKAISAIDVINEQCDEIKNLKARLNEEAYSSMSEPSVEI